MGSTVACQCDGLQPDGSRQWRSWVRTAFPFDTSLVTAPAPNWPALAGRRGPVLRWPPSRRVQEEFADEADGFIVVESQPCEQVCIGPLNLGVWADVFAGGSLTGGEGTRLDVP